MSFSKHLAIFLSWLIVTQIGCKPRRDSNLTAATETKQSNMNESDINQEKKILSRLHSLVQKTSRETQLQFWSAKGVEYSPIESMENYTFSEDEVILVSLDKRSRTFISFEIIKSWNNRTIIAFNEYNRKIEKLGGTSMLISQNSPIQNQISTANQKFNSLLSQYVSKNIDIEIEEAQENINNLLSTKGPKSKMDLSAAKSQLMKSLTTCLIAIVAHIIIKPLAQLYKKHGHPDDLVRMLVLGAKYVVIIVIIVSLIDIALAAFRTVASYIEVNKDDSELTKLREDILNLERVKTGFQTE